ncbi:MAG TPA: hypothetical protein P5179_14465, partial [Candidatus Latescibacteria bacterium]|nr:hypothetical protein [Candidatus Latescibacterota bacterium]
MAELDSRLRGNDGKSRATAENRAERETGGDKGWIPAFAGMTAGRRQLFKTSATLALLNRRQSAACVTFFSL